MKDVYDYVKIIPFSKKLIKARYAMNVVSKKSYETETSPKGKAQMEKAHRKDRSCRMCKRMKTIIFPNETKEQLKKN